MAKGSVRKKGSKWYYRFYVEDESGKLDLLSFGGIDANGKEVKPISKGYMRLFSAVLQGAFRFAVFPKRLLSYNPMQYVVMRKKQESYELFSDDNSDELAVPTITYEQYTALTDWLKKKNNPALLPIQIAYFTGLRIGEVCALTWQDIDLKEQKKEQHLNRFKYGELYSLNYCKEVKEKGRSYYELYTLGMTEEVPEDYKELSFVCLRPDGTYESASTVSIMCRTAQEKVPGLVY